MDMFQMITACDQFRGQPVEQGLVRWPATVKAEIVRRVDQPDAKVIVPQPVDDHAREERVSRIGDPLGQPQSAIVFRGICRKVERGRQCRNRADPAWCNDFLGLGRITTREQVRRFRLARLDRIHRCWLQEGNRRIRVRQGPLQLFVTSQLIALSAWRIMAAVTV